MSNRLAHETSPYLLQHAHNPVDWYPWCEAAIDRARHEDKPIFLSIGYSACHWCHVMEHECFESSALARLMNEHFVNIKVDREERPDLDHIYMTAVQAMTGRGGWPLSVFLTPQLEPFYGGTYWPPTRRMGMPGFDEVLEAVIEAWRNRRTQVGQQAQQLTQLLQRAAGQTSDRIPLELSLLQNAARQLEQSFDWTYGGFGRAPKFPRSIDLQLLLRTGHRWSVTQHLEMVTLTLDRMARGGIYDHLGGGFARYSVDSHWLVPHFEKMLYDNALLTQAYLDAYQATGQSRFARVAQETLDYVLRDMTDPEGGFYSTEDADSEGEEGKFYLWTRKEIQDILGPERAERFSYVYDVTDEGNFEGQNILNLPKTIAQCAQLKGWPLEQLEVELREDRDKLLAMRATRVRPGRDDKILVSWNALMIDAMARAAWILDQPRYLDAATRAAQFLRNNLRRDNGRLHHAWRQGTARFDAYLDDYTCLANALVTLHQSSFHEPWIEWALELMQLVLDHFADPVAGGFFFTADDHEALVARPKDLQDSSVPSGNSMAATALVRLGKLCGRTDFLAAVAKTFQVAGTLLRDAPGAAAQMLLALDLYLGPVEEIVVLGDPRQGDTRQALSALHRTFLPRHVIACRDSDSPASNPLDPLFSGKQLAAEIPTVYVCRDFTCSSPRAGLAEALQCWKDLATTHPSP